MSRPRSILFVVLAALALVVLGACGGEGDDDPGAQTYSRSCASCHGQNGQGGIGKSLEGIAERYTAEEHVDIVTNGTDGGMPPFGVSLSDEEIDAVVQYERESFK